MTSLGPNVENNWVFCLLVGLFLFLSTDNFVGVLALDDEVSLSGVAFNVTQGTLWASLENSSSEMAAPSGPARLLRARACGTATGCLGKRVCVPSEAPGPREPPRCGRGQGLPPLASWAPCAPAPGESRIGPFSSGFCCSPVDRGSGQEERGTRRLDPLRADVLRGRS